MLHPRPRLAGQVPDLELGDAGCEHGGPGALELLDRVLVLVRPAQSLGACEQRLDAAALVGGDAALEVVRVDAELLRQPLRRLARRAGLPALDLADVLLREAVAGQVGLRHARGHAQLPQALAQAIARGGGAADVCGSLSHDSLTGSQLHTSQVRKLAEPAIPLKGHLNSKSA